MPDSLLKLLDNAPFCLAGVNGVPKLNWAKVGEALITAVAIIAVGWFLFVEKEISSIKKDIEVQKESSIRMETKIDKIYNDIYKPSIGP